MGGHTKNKQTKTFKKDIIKQKWDSITIVAFASWHSERCFVAAYTLTESERFAPPRKKPKMMVNTYKLLSLNSTTPEELYARKIEMEEYGEALILAQHYDLVNFQEQVSFCKFSVSDQSVCCNLQYLCCALNICVHVAGFWPSLRTAVEVVQPLGDGHQRLSDQDQA